MKRIRLSASHLYLVLILLLRLQFYKATATASSTANTDTSPAIAPRARILPGADPYYQQQQQQNDGSLKNLVSRHPLRRFYQRLQKSQRCSSSADVPGRRRTNRGTRFSLRFPTPERVAGWYGSSSSTDRRRATVHNDDNKCIPNLLYDHHRSCAFNHGLVGMTNPTLHVSAERDVVPIVFSLSKNAENSNVLVVDGDGSAATGTTSVTNSDKCDPITKKWSQLTGMVRNRRLLEKGDSHVAAVQEASSTSQIIDHGGDPWWPGTTYSPNKGWRVLRLRQRVGKGKDCYERCRDAALAWEFQAVGQGMLPVKGRTSLIDETKSSSNQSAPATSIPFSRGQPINLDRHQEETISCSSSTLPNDQQTQHHKSSIQQIWSSPGRQLVTYTTIPKRGGWLIPHLYTVNPVTVVYDLVDQRAPGTTYTATAYATQAGHLLCGEERVSVCHRDYDDSVDVEILSISRASDSLQGRLVWPFIGRMQRTFFQQQLEALQRCADKA